MTAQVIDFKAARMARLLRHIQQQIAAFEAALAENSRLREELRQLHEEPQE